MVRPGENRAETDTGKNVHVVPLTQFVARPGVRHWLVRTSRRVNDVAVGPAGRVSEMPWTGAVAYHATASG